ncbi:hypothetical protein J6590_011997 [Homalodisca vitripennis]|nr:hypothetical protein J6590_011997 [Homalodisca vitripennis]
MKVVCFPTSDELERKRESKSMKTASTFHGLDDSLLLPISYPLDGLIDSTQVQGITRSGPVMNSDCPRSTVVPIISPPPYLHTEHLHCSPTPRDSLSLIRSDKRSVDSACNSGWPPQRSPFMVIFHSTFRHGSSLKNEALSTLNLGTIGLKVTSELPPTAGQAGCFEEQDDSSVTLPSNSHARRCLILLSCDNRCTRYTTPLVETHPSPASSGHRTGPRAAPVVPITLAGIVRTYTYTYTVGVSRYYNYSSRTIYKAVRDTDLSVTPGLERELATV